MEISLIDSIVLYFDKFGR